jgi:hypothetical protein
MTLAYQLKQKSKSINSGRLKRAAIVKQAAKEKALRLAANELAKKEREKEKERKWREEQKRLIKWLVPGLLSAWNQEDHIEYNLRSKEERTTAKKYLGYSVSHADVSVLNKELIQLEIDTNVLKDYLIKLRAYSLAQMPSLVFDMGTLVQSYQNHKSLFSKVWRNNLRREAVQFERAALASYSAKLKKNAATREKEMASKMAPILVDQDILQITRLADTLRPRIDTFRSQYWSLLNSPASIHLIQYVTSTPKSVNFAELVARRDYQLAVARHVLGEMKIYCGISHPDATGKFMAAFGVASGEDLYVALGKHITDPELTEKFDEYRLLLDANSNIHREIQLPEIGGQDVSDIMNSIFLSVERVAKILKSLDSQHLQIKQGQAYFCPSVRINDLSETTLYPEVDRLAYDIQWLRSPSGRKFKNIYTKHLNEIASDGKYSAKLKIFSKDAGMQIVLPSGKEILCNMAWGSFEQLMNMLGLKITETTSSGSVKLKWG